MIEDCGGSVEVRGVREKKDREDATDEEEDVYGWIRFPNEALNDYSHCVFCDFCYKTREERMQCEMIYIAFGSMVNPRS